MQDIRGQIFAVLAPKFPYNVTCDLDFDMIRLRLSKDRNYFCLCLVSQEMVVVFEIYEVKDRHVVAHKIPYYVTYDPKVAMYR